MDVSLSLRVSTSTLVFRAGATEYKRQEERSGVLSASCIVAARKRKLERPGFVEGPNGMQAYKRKLYCAYLVVPEAHNQDAQPR